jgi:DhnA family fructose-bisphosphate aldolase class Ia
MAENELTRVEQAIKAAADAVVADVVTTVRNHPDYATLVNDLAGKALQALMASV